jgi:hypothetical protein
VERSTLQSADPSPAVAQGAGPLAGESRLPPRPWPGAGRDGQPLAGRWLIAACFGVILIGPTLAIAAGERWGTVAAATVMLGGLVALTTLAYVALRRHETALRERARRDKVQAARRAAVEIAGAALSESDAPTAEHSDDVAQLCEVLCEEFAIEGDERERVLMAAHLHDVGKVAVSSEILNKPGPLDPEEWELVRKHTVIGERILEAVPELGQAAPIVRHSHERWDGGGYPDGLAGEEIPLASRIVLCADAFHAIRSDRPYRRGRPPSQAMAEMRANAGTQFDPSIVEALDGYAAHLRRRGPMGIPLPRRTVALLIGGVIAIVGTAMATGILPLSKPGADEPVIPRHDSSGPAAPSTSHHGGAHSAGHRAARNAAAARAGHPRRAHKSGRAHGSRRVSPAPRGNEPSPAADRGPDFEIPVRAHGHPSQAHGVARGRPPTVVPHGRGQ